MLIIMTTNIKGKDGDTIRTFIAGETYDIADEDLFNVFIDEGWCKAANSEEPETPSEQDIKALKDLTVVELREMAADIGIEHDLRAKKADLIQYIVDHGVF